MAQQKQIQLVSMSSIPGLAQWVKDHRLASDPELLWLWCRPSATAPIRPLAWKLPYAAGKTLKSKKERERGKEGSKEGGSEGRKEGKKKKEGKEGRKKGKKKGRKKFKMVQKLGEKFDSSSKN